MTKLYIDTETKHPYYMGVNVDKGEDFSSIATYKPKMNKVWWVGKWYKPWTWFKYGYVINEFELIDISVMPYGEEKNAIPINKGDDNAKKES